MAEINGEVFEPKEGADELWERLQKLDARYQSLALAFIFGGFKSSTHAEWGVFKKLLLRAIEHEEKLIALHMADKAAAPGKSHET